MTKRRPNPMTHEECLALARIAQAAKRPPIEERFWSRVNKGAPDQCWPWRGWRSKKGYGQFSFQHVGKHYTHRLAVILSGRNTPAGMIVMHACDNPPCCNPAHLRIATNADNLADMRAKGRGSTRRGPSYLSNPRRASPNVTKLKKSDIATIRCLVAQGIVQREIAAQFGVGQTINSQMSRRKIWRHVL